MPILGISAEQKCDDYPEPLTSRQAQNLRLKSPMISPWWVIAVQLGLGVVYVLLVAFWSQHEFGVVSAACGVGVVWVPALVFVAVISRGSAQRGVHSAALVFFVGEEIGSCCFFVLFSCFFVCFGARHNLQSSASRRVHVRMLLGLGSSSYLILFVPLKEWFEL